MKDFQDQMSKDNRIVKTNNKSMAKETVSLPGSQSGKHRSGQSHQSCDGYRTMSLHSKESEAFGENKSTTAKSLVRYLVEFLFTQVQLLCLVRYYLIIRGEGCAISKFSTAAASSYCIGLQSSQ